MTSPGQPIRLQGRGRQLPSPADDAVEVTLGDVQFTLAVGSDARVVSYRDVATIAVQEGATLLVLGRGTGAERFLLREFGQGQGQLVREIRERRLRQQLEDALIEDPTAAIELVEYATADEHAVALIAYHPWGVVLAPIDERFGWLALRRAAIVGVDVDESGGHVTVTNAGRGDRGRQIVLPGLGQRARLHADRLLGLRRAAMEDAGRLIAQLIPNAEYGVRQEAARLLVDGRPATPADLPAAWETVEAGVLVEPTFAASYQALRATAADVADLRAIALAPISPGADDAKSWFFVPLPGNLVALELVSEGAHATYLFRVEPRAEFTGGVLPAGVVRDAIDDISEALVDARFLREPMALPDDQLRQPKYLRYRLALAALPSLAAARRRFVGRVVHRDEASWAAAIQDAITWHGSVRDEAAVWPGRASQETMIEEAGGDDAGTGEAPATGEPATAETLTPGGS